MSDSLRDARPRSRLSRRSFLLGSAAALALACVPAGPVAPGLSPPGGPLVQTASGPVRGVTDGGVSRYLGIRYAAPISGANRFLPPQPVTPWTDVFVADRHADTAPQGPEPVNGTPVTPAFAVPDGVEPGDDCLALNIWAPAGAAGLPVMVWLHGGGWQSGSGSCAVYDGTRLARRGDVIVVTLNHRLGAHGFTDFSRILGGRWFQSSNLGVKDMVAALRWVKANIAAFGGDPDAVTIFGESGGGWKVNTLLGVPSTDGLFHRAVVESGPLTHFHTPEAADDVARRVLAALGISETDPSALESVSMEQLLQAERAVMAELPMSMAAPGFPSGFWPVLEEGFLPFHVHDPASASRARDVPLLLGQTGTEFSLFMLADEEAYRLDEAGLTARATAMLGPENATWILEKYREDFPSYAPSALWFRVFSDFAMGALSNAILDVRSGIGSAPVFAYRFDWMTPIEGGRLYSPHTLEIPFVFDNVDTAAGAVMTGNSEEAQRLAGTVSEAWVRFATTGRPSAPGLPDWPEYDSTGRSAMHLDVESRVAPYIAPRVAAFFMAMLQQRARAR